MASENYCSDSQINDNLYKTPLNNCEPVACSVEQLLSPNCQCSYPYTGILYFRAPSFSGLENESHYIALQKSLMLSFQVHELPVDSVSLSNPTNDSMQYLELSLKVFPSNQNYFNQTGTSSIGFLLSNQTFKPPKEFGPFFFNADTYRHFGKSVFKAAEIILIIVIAPF